jgi:citrate lyase alpha subunit
MIFPKLLGAELYRPHPAYIIEMAVEPVVVHDFSKQPGQTVQLIVTVSGVSLEPRSQGNAQQIKHSDLPQLATSSRTRSL